MEADSRKSTRGLSYVSPSTCHSSAPSQGCGYWNVLLWLSLTLISEVAYKDLQLSHYTLPRQAQAKDPQLLHYTLPRQAWASLETIHRNFIFLLIWLEKAKKKKKKVWSRDWCCWEVKGPLRWIRMASGLWRQLKGMMSFLLSPHSSLLPDHEIISYMLPTIANCHH